MSDIVNKKESRTVTFDRYTVAVALDGEMIESFALEGVDNTDNAFGRLLNWYLVYRSRNFPGLVHEEIALVKESSEKLELPENHPAIAKHRCFVPVKNDVGEVEKEVELTATFSSFKFGMLLG